VKRFTETEKWRDPWFWRLTPRAKLLWFYLTENCDCSGVIDLDFEMATILIGAPITESHLAELVDRVERTPDGKVFIPRFIPFQYGNLSETCPAHKPVLKLVTERHLNRNGKKYQYPNATLPLGYVNSDRRLQDKDKDKEKEKSTDTVRNLGTLRDAVRIKFERWIKFRRGMGKKPKDWNVLFEEQVDWLKQFDERIQLEIISQSMRNGYQGLFVPKEGPKQLQLKNISKVV
jgi:hypothetical protein